MKCYEVRKCSKEEREACYVWNSFRDNPQDIENVKCWVLKGAYQEESGQQLKKCKQCSYFAAMNREAGIASESDADIAVITCEGAINTERTKALEKVWETLRQQNRVKILLDMSRVSNIYSCGLGAIIKIHKEASAAKGQLVVVVNDEYIINLFTVTKLSRLLRIVKNNRDARDVFDALKKRELEAQKKAAEAADRTAKTAAETKAAADAKAAAEAAKPSKPKERPACWVYWKGQNPNNATKCDECFTKIKPTGQPCWIVDGMIEGISFQYVDQDCEACRYFQEFAGAEEL
ncbi:MAG TPA: STAS domain-containing protein [Chitinivibrionales bacterium]|nr:STAS domain-containing protein [Chitinivibrionales bacterium]